ncbi:MAG: hypothetical protein K8J09_19960 [Planctomycetes bacterium]|nr:hypothetical protein [Planctomycetota bacterium]MCC7398877.1 hypothetical protein [Planctomycetota bacterium]
MRAYALATSLLVCTGLLDAQVPTGRTAAAAAGVRATSASFAGVNEQGGALLGSSRSYRARFLGRSVEFQPCLGRTTPRAERLQVAFVAARRGDTVLQRADTAVPERTHDRRSVDYRWPSLVERYETTPQGLEQSFVIAEHPRGRGDLVIDLAITSSLTRAADGSMRWHNENGDGVRFGEVTGIDAHGARCRGSITRTATGAALALPAAFVDAAAYPLTLDPLIGTVSQAYPNGDCDFPDVAYDAYSDTYCIAWTQYFSTGVVGVVGSVFLADSLTYGYAFGINQSGDQDSVRVTSIGGTGLFVMVWVNYDAAGNYISGVAFEPVQAQATNTFDLDGPYGLSAPILSGEATVYDDDCLVAWLDDTYGLLGCDLTIDTNFQVSTTPITQLAGGNVTEAAFSKQGGNQGLHLLTWIDRPTGLPGWVRAQVIDHDLNVIGTGAWVQATTQDCGFPAVDGDGFKFLVAWEEQESGNPSSYDVRGKLLTIDSAGITTLGGALDLAAVAGDYDYAVDVAMLGDRFGIGYMVASPGGAFADDVYFRALQGTGAPIGDEQRVDVTPGTNYRYEHAPRLIGRRDGDPGTNADDGLLVFADQNVNTYDSDVGLVAIESLGPGGSITTVATGCGPGGMAMSAGPFALGNSWFPFELYGAEPLAVPFLLLGVPAPWLSCGVCNFVDPITLWFVPNTAGTAVSSMPVPGDAALVGFQLDFQFVSFNVLYVGCPVLPGVAASNIVRATLAY